MPANLENSAVATELEKVSFYCNPKERQCQRTNLQGFLPAIDDGWRVGCPDVIGLLQARVDTVGLAGVDDVLLGRDPGLVDRGRPLVAESPVHHGQGRR